MFFDGPKGSNVFRHKWAQKSAKKGYSPEIKLIGAPQALNIGALSHLITGMTRFTEHYTGPPVLFVQLLKCEMACF